MDNQLKWFLQESPTSVKELARLTGKTTSTIYKALKDPSVQSQDGENGKLFFIAPDANEPEAVLKPQETPEMVESTLPAPEPAVVANGTVSTKRGRKATAAGQRLTATTVMDQPDQRSNPRRKDSHGHLSLQIIIDRPGIKTEEFVALGGRLNDLRWDIKAGNVSVLP